jgi:NAD-dependent dihydropyrimidine dehydrogenase PreA subunit
MPNRLAVVVSQGQSANPAKRQLEEEIVTGLLFEPGIDVVVIPHLYDLTPEGTGRLALEGIGGNMVVLSWLYERAARWTLDRFGIRGKEGITLIKPEEDDEEEEGETESAEADDKQRVADLRPAPNRRIYCIDLRVHNAAAPYIAEVKRIAKDNSFELLSLGGIGGLGTGGMGIGAGDAGRGSRDAGSSSPTPAQLARLARPTNDTALPLTPEFRASNSESPAPHPAPHVPPPAPLRVEEEAARRWYPVIDFSRCTNCMECIDFCLFGVYGVDGQETILVEQPDNCRKGCPACSRVCPENAIIFPQHKTPAIAGADMIADGGLKIDLSKLFGAPDKAESAADIAVRERDEQLMLAGRAAVGDSVGLPKRQEAKSTAPKDELDSLLDQLDDLNI